MEKIPSWNTKEGEEGEESSSYVITNVAGGTNMLAVRVKDGNTDWRFIIENIYSYCEEDATFQFESESLENNGHIKKLSFYGNISHGKLCINAKN
jgi:hypothetical protein